MRYWFVGRGLIPVVGDMVRNFAVFSSRSGSRGVG